jgi:hypothetical protein
MLQFSRILLFSCGAAVSSLALSQSSLFMVLSRVVVEVGTAAPTIVS